MEKTPEWKKEKRSEGNVNPGIASVWTDFVSL